MKKYRNKKSYLIFITSLFLISFTIYGCFNDIKDEINKNLKTEIKNEVKNDDDNKIILVNKTFIDALTNKSVSDSMKIKNAFYSLKIVEPILFGLFPGDIKHYKMYNPDKAGSDYSSYTYSKSYRNYAYTLKNTENIFNIALPDYPKEIINQWRVNDTAYYQVIMGDNKFKTEAIYSLNDKNNNKIYILNNSVEMYDINKYLAINDRNYEITHTNYMDILNSLVQKYCGDSLMSYYELGVSEFWDYNKGNYEKSTNSNIIEYGKCLNKSGQLPFKTKHLNYAEIKIFPRFKDRNSLNISFIDGIYGINQFFMDHDLTSGFVHPFTANFYERLPQDGYVLVYERSTSRINQGRIKYKKKSELSIPTDKLGQNVAFCRQWKLSDFGITDNQILMAKSKYNTKYFCPQVKKGSKNPYNPEIPILSTYNKEGYVDFRLLNSLTDFDGGTVVIIWTTINNETLFMDMHGSIADIIIQAREIQAVYKVDPTIGIYDAGTFARKFKSNDNGRIDFNNVDNLTGKSEFVGAGYGYLKPE